MWSVPSPLRQQVGDFSEESETTWGAVGTAFSAYSACDMGDDPAVVS